MSFDALRKSIYDQFIANWNATNLNRIVFGDNFEPLKVGVLGDENAPWCRLSYNVLDTENAEIGTTFQRAMGIITLQIFVKAMTGEKRTNELMANFVSVYQNKQFGNVTCYTVTPVRIGRDGNSYQTNAKVTFEYDVFS